LFHNSKLIKNYNTLVISFNYWGLLVVNGVVRINSCNEQMLWHVVFYPFVMQVNVRNLSQGKNNLGFEIITISMAQFHLKNTLLMNILSCTQGVDCSCYRQWQKQMRNKLQRKGELSHLLRLQFIFYSHKFFFQI